MRDFTLTHTYTIDRRDAAEDDAALYDVELTWFVEACERWRCCGRCETLTLDGCAPQIELTEAEREEAEALAREVLEARREW